MTTNHLHSHTATDPDVVVLGLLDDESSHTRGTRVAHSRPGFIGEADAVPFHDTQREPLHDRMSATGWRRTGACSFGANNGTESRGRARQSPVVITLVSAALAIAVSSIWVTAVWLAGRVVDAASPVVAVSVVAAVLCGLVLVLASIVGGRGR